MAETTWTGSAHDNAWTTAGNWSNGVPSATTYACVPGGAATITVAGSANASGLLLGTGNSLTISTGAVTLHANPTPSALEGDVSIHQGASLSVLAGAVVLNATGGDITNVGGLIVAGGFEQDAGQVETGGQNLPVDMVAGSSLTFAGTGAGAFEVYDPNAAGQTMAVSLAGDIAAQQSLDVETGEFGAIGSGTTSVNAAGSFKNAGTITIEHVTSNAFGSVAFNLPSGKTLTNVGTCTATGVSAQFSGTQTFTGNFTNQGGTLNVGTATGLPANFIFASGDTVLNSGAVVVANGSALTVSSSSNTAGAAVFKNETGGAITTGGSMVSGGFLTGFLVPGSFEQDAGQVATGGSDGPIDLLAGSSLAFGGSGKGAFEVYDPNAVGQTMSVSLAGDLAAQQSLDVQTGEFGAIGSGKTIINAAQSFANAGAITLDHVGGSSPNGSIAFDLPPGQTLTNAGTFTVLGAPNQVSNTETFTGNFTNQGGVLNAGLVAGPNERAPTNLSFQSGDDFLNMGTITLNIGSVMALQSGTFFTNGTGGSITDNNPLGSPPNPLGFLDAGAFEQDAGVVASGASLGPVDLQGGSSLDFGGQGAGAFAFSDPNAPSGNFTVSLAGDLAPQQSLDIKAGGFGQFGSGLTTVDAAGSFTNAGAITVEAGGAPSSDSGHFAFTFPSNSSLTNTGSLSVGAGSNLSATTQTFGCSITNLGVFSVSNQAQVVITGNLTSLAGSTTGANMLNHPNQTMITVNGKTTLSGTLNFQTDPTANLTAGELFHVLSSPTIVAGFDSVTGLYAGGQLVYDVSQDQTTIDARMASETSSPQMFGINPSAGPAATTVTIFGADLTGTSAVRFGSKSSTGFTVVSSTQVTAIAPAGISIGTSVPITVTTPNGTTPSVGAAKYKYAGSPSGSAGSARLNLTIKDRVGNALPGVTVGISDSVTHNPSGLIQTGANGSGSLIGLSKGETVQADVVGVFAPYGAASADYRLSAGVNSKVLTLPIQPLLTSDLTATGPDGNPEAVWPQISPQPGTAIPGGGTLSSPRTLADVEFTLHYTTGDKFILSSDSLGTQPFCVDGKWTLTLSGPAPSTNVVTHSGAGCPATGAPFNIGTTLSLSSGTYGGEFKAVAPAGASTAGSTDIYLLPPAGKLTDLRVTPGQVAAHAQLGGTDTSVVGASSKLNAILGGFPIPGAQVYDVTFSYNPAGISVTSRDYPARWGAARQTGSFPNGIGVFYETNRGYPIPIGGTVVTLELTCNQAGIWPVSYAGNYAVPQVVTSYITLAVEGSGVVICNPPPPAANTSTNGVSIDPTTGDVSATVTGANLGLASKAELLTLSGAVAARSTTVASADTVATADFPPTPPGLYNLSLFDSHGATVAATAGAPLEVAPALPLFNLGASDIVDDVPGIATTHSYTIADEGTLNGVAVFAFSFPSYITVEPILNLAGAPPGTRLLLHGMTSGGWAEYVAVPVATGFSEGVSWTYTVPPDAVFGSNPSIGVNQPMEIVPALAGQYSAPEWASESAKTDQQIVDSAMAQGMDDYSAAFSDILALGPAQSEKFLADLSDQTMADAITYVGQAVLGKVAARESQLMGQDQVVAPPAGIPMPTPPPASSTPQPSDSLNDPSATSFANFSFNTGVAMVAGYGTNNPVPTDGKPTQANMGGANGANTLVGTVNTYQDGILGPVVSISPVSTDTVQASASLAASWDASPNVNTNAWTSGLDSALTFAGPSGPITAAALPLQETTFEITAFSTPGIGPVEFASSTVVKETSTFVGHVYVSDPGAEVASHKARRAVTSAADDVSQYDSSAKFGTAWSIVSNAFPSGTGVAVAVGFGILGLVSGGFVVGVICGVAGEVLGGTAQMMVQYANTSNVPNGVNAGHKIITSLDPNDIQVQPSGGGARSWISPQPITYTVRFFNEPTATAPAFNVVVKLPLDPNLDPSTVQPGPASFPGTQFAYDPVSKMVTWNLPNIDLPPDTSPPNGEASVSFTVRPKKGLKTGTEIHESAQVLFDFNPPINTPLVTSTIDATRPTASLLIGSRKGSVIPLSWKLRSSVPIAGSQLEISVDGGPLVPLLQTKTTSFEFHGSAGHTYGFAVQALDIGGQSSKPPSVPTASVLTTCPAKPSNRLTCAQLANGKWSGLTVPGYPASKLNIAVQGQRTPPESMTIENTPCPTNGLKHATCFRFSAFNTITGLHIQTLGQRLAFTSTEPVFLYAKNRTFVLLRKSSKSKPLTVESGIYMWVP